MRVPTGNANLRVMVIGKGAGELALAQKLSQSPSVRWVLVFPGNRCTQSRSPYTSPKMFNVCPCVAEDYYSTLLDSIKATNLDLVVVASQKAVMAGFADWLMKVGIRCCAPSQYVAQLEGSVMFAKAFIKEYRIPNASHQVFVDDSKARRYLETVGNRVVVRGDGVGEGRGVVVPKTHSAAVGAVSEVLGQFANTGSPVLIEEFMHGEEISILTLSDGARFVSLDAGQEASGGSASAGTSFCTPVTSISKSTLAEADEKIIRPTLMGMVHRGHPLLGVLRTRIMITSRGPRVIDYSVRFRDMETQGLVTLLSPKTDLAAVLFSCTNGTLDQSAIHLRSSLSVLWRAVNRAKGSAKYLHGTT